MILVVVALASVLLFPPARALAAPSVSLSPATGEPGAIFQVDGSGFPALALVTLLWDGLVPLGVVTADAGGSFTTHAQVPHLTASGGHRVVATAVTHNAGASFTVESEADTPPSTVASTTTTSTTTTSTTTTSSTVGTTTSTVGTTTTTNVTSSPAPTPTTGSTPPGRDTSTPDSPPTTPSTLPGPASSSTPDTDDQGGESLPDGRSPTDVTAAPVTSTIDESSLPPEVLSAGSESVLAATPGNTLWPDAEAPLPHLAGLSLRPKALSIDPTAGGAGTEIRISLSLEQPLGGFFSITFMLGDTPLGEAVSAHGAEVSVSRVLPDLPPGTYSLSAWTGDLLLARADIEIVDRKVQPVERIALALVVVTLAALGWKGFRTFVPGRRAGSR